MQIPPLFPETPDWPDLNRPSWWNVRPHHRWQRHRPALTAMVSGSLVQRCTCGAFGPAPWVLIDRRRTIRQWKRLLRKMT